MLPGVATGASVAHPQAGPPTSIRLRAPARKLAWIRRRIGGSVRQLGGHGDLGGVGGGGEDEVTLDVAGAAEVGGGGGGGLDEGRGTGHLDPGERGAHRDLRLGLRAADADQGGGDGVEQGGVGVDLEAVVAL